MKYIKIMIVAMVFMLATMEGQLVDAKAQEQHQMTVTSTGIINGVIADQYGSKGTQFGPGGMPTYSLPLKISNAPKGTVSYAIVIDDYDAIPLFGFTWVHWVVANLEKNELAANESLQAKNFVQSPVYLEHPTPQTNESPQAKGFVQGANSWYGKLGGLDAMTASVYGGMAPPDKAHTYNIKVYALDTKLPLEDGFFLNQLYHQMEGHILAQTVLKGVYANK